MDETRAWRWTSWGFVAAHAIGAALTLVTGGMRPFTLYSADNVAWNLAGLVAAGWAVEHARRGLRGLLPLGGVAVAAVFAWWSAHAAGDHPDYSVSSHDVAIVALQWAAIAVPPLLLLAHGARRPGLVSLAGAAATMAGAALIAARVQATGVWALTLPERALTVLGTLALTLGLVLAARRPSTLPPVRTRVPAATLVGAMLLGLSWWLGGQLSVLLPLWMVAPVVLALPALLAWRARPLLAAAALVLLVGGAFLPAAECTYPFVTDAPRPGDPLVSKVQEESAWAVAGRGPWWRQDDLMAAYPVLCSPRLPALAAGWLVGVALVGAAGPFIGRRSRSPAGS